MNKTKNPSCTSESGFTLIEMIVATALFAVVMLISTAALLALVNANRKAQALQSTMNNLNVALDGMVRAIRMGSAYHCGNGASINYEETRDCEEGNLFSFTTFEGERWIYWFDEEEGRIYKSETGDIDDGRAMTAPTVDIESLQFYVVGTERGLADSYSLQPKAMIIVKGVVGAEHVKTRTSFSIQATAVQRILDL